jgi:hypothetical protein
VGGGGGGGAAGAVGSGPKTEEMRAAMLEAAARSADVLPS